MTPRLFFAGLRLGKHLQPIPATLVGLAFYSGLTVADLPVALGLTAIRVVVILGLLAGLPYCIMNR